MSQRPSTEARIPWSTGAPLGRWVARWLSRAMPTENQRVWLLTLLVGALSGLAAVGFHLSIQLAERFMIEPALDATGRWWIVLGLVVPVVGGLVSGALLTYVFPNSRGSGIPQVKVAYSIEGGQLPLRQGIGKFLVSTLQIGTGASLGREGPTVQICAAIASTIGRAARLSEDSLRRMLPVGAAAGIAAAFNAPIAAVTFTVEEVVGDLDHTVLAGVVVAAALAAAIEHVALGSKPVFDVPTGLGIHHLDSLLLFLLLGLVAAAVSLAFTESLLALRMRFRHSPLPIWTRPAVGGLMTGGLAVAGIGLLGQRGITGGGYDTLTEALHGGLAWRIMLALCAMKLAATVFSYSSGMAGGIFAPSLFLGGMVGGAVGTLDVALLGHERSVIGAFALVGMGAVFAGIIRAPITSVLIIYEMTGNYRLILPLMMANMLAFAIARHIRPIPIYEALLAQDGLHLPHDEPTPHVLDLLTVGDAMTDVPGDNESVDRTLILSPDQPLHEALVAMERSGRYQAVVLDPTPGPDGPQVVGLLTVTGIIRAQARALES
ncbi:MAG: chloride channel protein [Acidimicrobiales bacterium]